MQAISIDELINYKILPFNLYTEKGKRLFSSGEVLTPGKILQLKYVPVIFMDADQELFYPPEELMGEDPGENPEDEPADEEKEEDRSFITDDAQELIKEKYKILLDSFSYKDTSDVDLCLEVRDNIVEEILPEVHKVLYKSQLKIRGDYSYSHGINVAMLAALLAHKMRFNEQAIKDITLGAILHDIGKTKIPINKINKSFPTQSETRLLQLHTKLGHKIIKKEMNLADKIANIALQHHEHPDGSGYPYRLSGKQISVESQIVSICNVYDKLTSGKGEIRVKTAKDAVKHLLELGTKHFKSDVLYTFVHMTNYNDTTPISADLNK